MLSGVSKVLDLLMPGNFTYEMVKVSNEKKFFESKFGKNSQKTCFPAMESFFKLKKFICALGLTIGGPSDNTK